MDNYKDQIEQLETQIRSIKDKAVLHLKAKLAEQRNAMIETQKELDAFTGETSVSQTPQPHQRRSFAHITIDQIKDAITAGSTNYATIAKALDVTTGKVRTMIEKEGAAANIASSGSRSSFRLYIKFPKTEPEPALARDTTATSEVPARRGPKPGFKRGPKSRKK